MRINVKTLEGCTFEFDSDPSETIASVKARIKDKRLIFRGKEMEDRRTLSDYNVQEDAVLHCVFRTNVRGSRTVRPSRPQSPVVSRHRRGVYDRDYALGLGEEGGTRYPRELPFDNRLQILKNKIDDKMSRAKCVSTSPTTQPGAGLTAVTTNGEPGSKMLLAPEDDDIYYKRKDLELIPELLWQPTEDPYEVPKHVWEALGLGMPHVELAEPFERLHNRIKDMNYLIRTERERADRLSRELDDTRSQLDDIYVHREQEKHYIEQLEQQISLFRNSWEQNVENYREELSSLRTENTGLRQFMEKQTIRYNTLDFKFEDSKQARSRMQIRLDQMDASRKALKAEVAQLKSELKDTRSRAKQAIRTVEEVQAKQAQQIAAMQVAKDPMEEFFKLTAFAVKFKLAQQHGLTPAGIISDLWNRSQVEGIQFHDYGAWLENEFRTLNNVEDIPAGGADQTIFVNLGSGSVLPIEVNKYRDTVGSVKSAIHTSEGIPIPNQSLVYRPYSHSSSLKDYQRLSDVNVQRHSTLHLNSSTK